ncbi:hypothetical protein BpHYR1_035197 [Brachionus plicatilis]|uniref:Uncharacterized protein n=1 Tax=Brachionus plicatilis TaxID=10195 RepID=A0A3M7T932_BRAPC|nr:hypothetical protein BpHYR1_035197 [Brachionus plicatilis]
MIKLLAVLKSINHQPSDLSYLLVLFNQMLNSAELNSDEILESNRENLHMMGPIQQLIILYSFLYLISKNQTSHKKLKTSKTRYSEHFSRTEMTKNNSFNRICKFVDDLIHGGEQESATSIKKIINRSQINKNLDPSDRDLINFLQFYKNKINKINDIDFISEFCSIMLFEEYYTIPESFKN